MVSYLLLAIAIIFLLFTDSWVAVALTGGAAVLIALHLQDLHIVGICWLGALCIAARLYGRTLQTSVKLLSFGFLTAFFIALISHKIPGLSSGSVIINNIQLSEASPSFSITLYFGIILSAFIFHIGSDLYHFDRQKNAYTCRQTVYYLLLTVVPVLLIATLSGYTRWEPKTAELFWPREFDMTAIPLGYMWLVSNFLSTYTEEVLFRGFLQRAVRNWTVKVYPYLHIAIIAAIFGLAHIRHGGTYALLATICGWSYGYVYEKTQSLASTTITHLSVNLLHFTFFCYPSVLR